MPVDPIVLQIVEGTLASIEAEVEAAIERTARSPMIRDQHDYRAGIHDRRARKLTGRSYSALVNPIIRDFPLESMKPGDVYFHNDVYLSEGGIGHLPDLCSTVPVFFEGEVVAFVQAFGHHDDIGGMVPGSMPAKATSIFQEGLMIPPIKLYEADARNEAAYAIIFRNTRLPHSLQGDIDGEIAACHMGARRVRELFERYGRELTEACFEAILQRCADNFRREILPRIPNGTYAWEDYVEHDGVEPDHLHVLKMTMTKSDDKIVLDLNGTAPQSKGPINWPGNYSDGRFLIKWAAVALRNLAATPERMAELEINEGICDVIEVVFPEEPTIVSPRFPAATNARSFTILRLIGLFVGVLAHAVDGMVPADQETIRYWGLHGFDEGDGSFFLLREVLGGGSGGRYYADGEDCIHIVPDSKNLPVEFAETRFPIIVDLLGLAQDSGGPGMFRGGLGYQKDIRALQPVEFISTADRSILSCYGVRGGKAGLPYRATVNPGAATAVHLPGMVDNFKLEAGDVIRLETTGGGGWGDPLARSPELVLRDVVQGRVSEMSALNEYGVVLASGAVDVEATAERRRRLSAECCPTSLIDRGPGFDSFSNS
ncbi:MAG TPA: hydantoinase B/oxoprolinase family protein [Chloroflexota bacterium]|jgi:N-methylhydantoinase B|nr:hydantoinase B/oxoprolinase family protein [Chloroflexota bacterium]